MNFFNASESYGSLGSLKAMLIVFYFFKNVIVELTKVKI